MDLHWGQKSGLGGGFIAVLPIGEKFERAKNFSGADNRITLDPEDCEFCFSQDDPVIDQVIGAFMELKEIVRAIKELDDDELDELIEWLKETYSFS
jgi:hypothetical protein